jgi:hypothetical protein
MPVPITSPFLKFKSKNGSPVNEYRIRRGRIEFRSLDKRGRPFSYNHGTWAALDNRDIQLHFALNTPVARWLIARLVTPGGSPQPLRAAPMDST